MQHYYIKKLLIIAPVENNELNYVFVLADNLEAIQGVSADEYAEDVTYGSSIDGSTGNTVTWDGENKIVQIK